MTSFNSDEWIDCGTYYLNKNQQGSDKWRKQRSFRLTASNFGTAVGKNIYQTKETLANIIKGKEKPVYSEKSKIAIDHGNKTEKIARTWYEKKYKTKVKEVGVAIPKWNVRIGSSVDGLVGDDGIIEIKCPFYMYEPIIEYNKKFNEGFIFEEGYHEHIQEMYYAQMQGSLKILNRQFCDFIVFATESDEVFVQRIFYDEKYWEETLCPGINSFIENYLS